MYTKFGLRVGTKFGIFAKKIGFVLMTDEVTFQNLSIFWYIDTSDILVSIYFLSKQIDFCLKVICNNYRYHSEVKAVPLKNDFIFSMSHRQFKFCTKVFFFDSESYNAQVNVITS